MLALRSTVAAALARRARPPRACTTRCMTTRDMEAARNRHLRTLHTVFAHPTAHNLRWRDVVAMLEAFGGTHSSAHGKERVELNGRLHFVTRPSGRHADHQEMGTADVLGLRKFLEAAGIVPDDACLEHPHHSIPNPEKPSQRQPERIPPESRDGRHALALVSHLEARLFEKQLPGTPPRLLHPADAARHLHHKASPGHSAAPPRGKDYDPVLDVRFARQLVLELERFDEIILAGHATGKSSALDALLRAMPPGLRGRVVATMHLSEGHTTDNKLLARARHFFNARADELQGRAGETPDGTDE